MKNIINLTIVALVVASLSSCVVYQNKWVKSHEYKSKSDFTPELKSALSEGSRVSIAVKSPGFAYDYDIGEKDTYYDHASGNFMIDSIHFDFKSLLSSKKLLADVTAVDKIGNRFVVRDFDVLKLVHHYDTQGDLLYAETIEEEFNRFGMSFRREHGEFEVHASTSDEFAKVLDRVIRFSITNNCLEPTRWEVAVVTEDFSDFKSRARGKVNFNQKRTLSHGWFYMDADMYSAMLKIKNPDKPHDYAAIHYDTASAIGENTHVDFSKFRFPIARTYRPWMLEVGHKSKRILEPVDMEEHYKWEFGIFLNKNQFSNYSNILDQPVKLARFGGQGFYNDATPNIYDYSYLKHVDKVELKQLSSTETNSYFEIAITGEHAPYEITLGNVDLALLSDLKMRGFLFGFNTYPKGRRYNHSQNTTSFDPETFPDKRMRPYLVMTDRNTGKYMNNQKKGMEKLYIGYEDANKTRLIIYLLSYERITPIWMARVRVPAPVHKSISAKKNLY